MLAYIKLTLRISNDAYDLEIQTLIDACKRDLTLVGINNISESDAFVKQAISAYCKANFGLSNSDSEKYRECYESLKRFMCLSLEYTY